MSELAFLSPSRCPEETLASPLRRALDGVEQIEDLSLQGKIELRGPLDRVEPLAGEELVRLSPRRGFLFTSADPAHAAARIRERGVLAYDVSAGWAGFAVTGEQLMRRLTDLDLDRLPSAGPFARVQAIVVRDVGERFRLYVPQELGHDVVLALVDAARGLGMNA